MTHHNTNQIMNEKDKTRFSFLYTRMYIKRYLHVYRYVMIVVKIIMCTKRTKHSNLNP